MNVLEKILEEIEERIKKLKEVDNLSLIHIYVWLGKARKDSG